MRCVTDALRINGRYVFVLIALIVLFAISGCAGQKIAPDLLANVTANETPLRDNSSIIDVTINPRINNSERLDESVAQSLEIALKNSNIFTARSSTPYKIKATILTASQAVMSFGSFEGKLEIRYVVHGPDSREVLDKTIFTVAGSDKWSFSGAARHRRARAVNISKNVLEFVNVLQALLQK